MTALSQSTKRKPSLLRLAAELGNVSKACPIMGYHRDSLYEIKRAFQRRGPRSAHPNRFSPETESAILDDSPKFPTHGAARTANELRLGRITVSGSGVRGVWLRHDLETRDTNCSRAWRASSMHHQSPRPTHQRVRGAHEPQALG